MEQDRPWLIPRRPGSGGQTHDAVSAPVEGHATSIYLGSSLHLLSAEQVPLWDVIEATRKRKTTVKREPKKAKHVNRFRQIPGLFSHLRKWQVGGRFDVFLLIGLYIFLCAAAVTAVECPEKCACVVSHEETLEETAPNKAALTAINCSSVGLGNFSLRFSTVTTAAALNFTTKNDTATDNDNSQRVVTAWLDYLDLSGNRLTSPGLVLLATPDWPNVTYVVQITHLDLSSNAIEEIQPEELTAYNGVGKLDLSSNMLHGIGWKAFVGLDSVTDLNLSHNAIGDLANDTFLPLVRLQVLDLSFNQLNILLLPQLHGLSSLMYLYLNDNNLYLMTTPDRFVFPSLPSLVHLDLSNNPLQVIPEAVFRTLPLLATLDLRNCSVQSLDKRCLDGLPHLQELQLDQNDLSGVYWPVFRNTSLIRLSLTGMLNLRNISHDAFLGLSRLVYLNLSHNPELSFIHPHLLTPLTNLRVLDLSESRLTQLSEITFRENQHLAEVYLLHNPFTCSCVNAWLAAEALAPSTTQFVDVSSLFCLTDAGQHSVLGNASAPCEEIQIYNMTSTVIAKLGTSLLLACQYQQDDASVLVWTIPRGHSFYHHHFHPAAIQHLLTPDDIHPGAQFHKGHYWHHSSSYHSELDSYTSRITILSDGSLYIDYMLRSDAGPYRCQVSNAMYNHSFTVNLYVDCTLSTDVKIFGILVGFLCALTFFTLNVIYVIISWIARRLVNKRRREIIRQMLENLNTYKSSQVTRIHENYIHQLNRVRNQYHIQRDKLHRNYTLQVDKMKRGCSNQVERVRENYHAKLQQLREYSSSQILQIRERTNNQIVRIRDYGSLQLDKLRETYKLQQQHVLKLLDTMNLDNCRNVVETECMRAESMMYDIDILGDDDRTDSPVSPADSEYNTAASSPASSMDDHCDAGLSKDMSHHQSQDSTDNSIIIEIQSSLDLECGHNDYYVDGLDYSVTRESLRQPRNDMLLHTFTNRPRSIQFPAPLPTFQIHPEIARAELSSEASRGGHNRTDSDGNSDGVYVTPEASPTKVWTSGRSLSCFEKMDSVAKGATCDKDYDLDFIQDLDSLCSETII